MIDNGSSECRAGYRGNMVLRFPNKFYKLKDHISFECVNGYAEKPMFDNDVITNFENMEIIFDRVFSKIKLQEPNGLILTERPFTPNFSRKRTLETVFELYRFKKLQLGIDAVYSMHQNRVCGPAVVISLSHLSTDVIFIEEEIKQVFRLGFGAKQCKKYIAMTLCNKYPRLKATDEVVDEMLLNLRACEDYDRECLDILEHSRKGDFVDDYVPSFLQDNCTEEGADARGDQHAGAVLSGDGGRHRDVRADDRSAVRLEGAGTAEDRGGRERADTHEEVGRDSRSQGRAAAGPQHGDGECGEASEANDVPGRHDAGAAEGRDDERRDRIAYFSLVYRLKQRIAKELGRLSRRISAGMDCHEIKTDFHGYLERMKSKLHMLKRDLKQRENILREVKNKKSVFARIKRKSAEAVLSRDEEDVLSRIQWAEDEETHTRILQDIRACTSIIRQHEPDFEPFEVPTSKVLQGLAIERRKIPEIIFEPSIINLNGVGLSEILEIQRAGNIFITGGFSQVAGLDARIRFEAQSLVGGGALSVQRARDPVHDAFFGAHFSPYFPVFTLGDYEEFGAEYLVERMEF